MIAIACPPAVLFYAPAAIVNKFLRCWFRHNEGWGGKATRAIQFCVFSVHPRNVAEENLVDDYKFRWNQSRVTIRNIRCTDLLKSPWLDDFINLTHVDPCICCLVDPGIASHFNTKSIDQADNFLSIAERKKSSSAIEMVIRYGFKGKLTPRITVTKACCRLCAIQLQFQN